VSKDPAKIRLLKIVRECNDVCIDYYTRYWLSLSNSPFLSNPILFHYNHIIVNNIDNNYDNNENNDNNDNNYDNNDNNNNNKY
jgi:hypothetical protein